MILSFNLESGPVCMQRFIEGGAREWLSANITARWRCRKLFFEINILSSKLGDVRVTATKIMANIHV